MPQIEVTFDIDANGILQRGRQGQGHRQGEQDHHQGNSGLSEAEIQKMVKDAEPTPPRTRSSNWCRPATRATRWCTASEEAWTEHGDKLDGAEKEKIEAALKDAEEASRGGQGRDRSQDRRR